MSDTITEIQKRTLNTVFTIYKSPKDLTSDQRIALNNDMLMQKFPQKDPTGKLIAVTVDLALPNSHGFYSTTDLEQIRADLNGTGMQTPQPIDEEIQEADRKVKILENNDLACLTAEFTREYVEKLNEFRNNQRAFQLEKVSALIEARAKATATPDY